MKQPRICVSVAAADRDGAIEATRKAVAYSPDLIEVRLDYMERVKGLGKLRSITELPIIATNRPKGEGGWFTGSEKKRIGTLLSACETGFDYVDLELTASESIDLIRDLGARVILSHHNFSDTPPLIRLNDILDEMLKYRPDICKIVGTARKVRDNLTYLELISRSKGKTGIVSFGMGEAGLLSRILSPLIGGEYTYASTGEGEETAQGQLPIGMMRDLYRMLEF